MIYAGTVRRKLWDFFVFEDVGEFGIFEENRCRSGGDGGYEMRIRIEVNRSGEGFLVTGNIGNREKKEFIALWIDSTRR